jgi:hypothetical protein
MFVIGGRKHFAAQQKTAVFVKLMSLARRSMSVQKLKKKLARLYLEISNSEKVLQYMRLCDRLCDKQKEKFCCKENTAGKTITNIYETSRPRTNPITNVFDGTFLPLASERMCGLKANQRPSFIINGKDSKPGQYTFMALLGRKVRKRDHIGRIKRVTEWVCGGTLINHWYVLTAAYCQDFKYPMATVQLGDWDISTKDCIGDFCLPKPQDFEIKRENFLLHASYVPATANHQNVLNDVALIRLPRAAIPNAGVQFGCLPLTPHDLAAEI